MGDEIRKLDKVWKKGDPILASDLNRLEQKVSLLTSGGIDGCAVSNGAGTFYLPRKSQAIRLGKLTEELSREGIADFVFCSPDPVYGGVRADMEDPTNQVIDPGYVHADHPLPDGSVILVVQIEGCWVLANGDPCSE